MGFLNGEVVEVVENKKEFALSALGRRSERQIGETNEKLMYVSSTSLRAKSFVGEIGT